LSLCLNKHHAMNAYEGVKVKLHVFLKLALDGGEWSASRPGRFTPATHWIWGWVGAKTGMDAVAKRKIPNPLRELNPGRPARSLVTIPTELSLLQLKHKTQVSVTFPEYSCSFFPGPVVGLQRVHGCTTRGAQADFKGRHEGVGRRIFVFRSEQWRRHSQQIDLHEGAV
jgi:hypothetical protein